MVKAQFLSPKIYLKLGLFLTSSFLCFHIHCCSQLEDAEKSLLTWILFKNKRDSHTHTFWEFVQGDKTVGEDTSFVIPLSLRGRKRRKQSENFNLFETGCPSNTPAVPQTQPFITTILLRGEKGFYKQLNELNSQIWQSLAPGSWAVKWWSYI